MDKYYAKYLTIEVTRRCNMTCAHCLCGDAQNLDIDHKYIRNLLQHFTSIYQLTITGGEPSLVPKTIRYILKQLKRFCIDVNYFYIVTNGSRSSMSQEFIDACVTLYDYQDDKEERHMLEMSDDRFHCDRDRAEVVATLSQYPFFGVRGQSKNIYLLKEGRCKNGVPVDVHRLYLTDQNYVYDTIFLNCKGEILGGCNLSYQRQSENVLCHSGNFRSYIKSTLRTR